MSAGKKAGIAIGVLVAIAVVAVGIIVFFKYRRNDIPMQKLKETETDSGMNNLNFEPEPTVSDLPGTTSTA